MSAGYGTQIVFYLNFFLLLGVALRHWFKFISQFIPYTVLLLVIGVFLGIGARPEESDAGGGAYGNSLLLRRPARARRRRRRRRRRGLDVPLARPAVRLPERDAHPGVDRPAHDALHLPAGAALRVGAAIDFHVFKKVLAKTVTLAFPGMACGALMMSCVVKLAYPTWTWDLCLLLGTITSATDPVAVVALLRELGAKVSLSTTIEGESLLNDGSAVVLFSVLKVISEVGGDVIAAGGPGQIALVFLVKAVGGPIIGVVFGRVALVWISHVFNDPMVEISISLTVAYLAYYVSEFWLSSSGVLTVVTVGLCFAAGGRTSISPEVFHFLHEFWETLGYVANTLIFLVTGIAIAYHIPTLPASDYLISFGIYAAGLVIRMVLFSVTYLPFTRASYGWTWKEMLIASWGGLRGAVGLALGLSILFDTKSSLDCPADLENVITCDKVKSRILLHTSTMVVCTLVINASTMKPLLKVLRFVELSREEMTMLALVAERLKKDATKEMKRIQDDPFLSNSNWEVVRQYADLNELFRPLLKGMTVKKADAAAARRASKDAAATDGGEGGAPPTTTLAAAAAAAAGGIWDRAHEHGGRLHGGDRPRR